MEARQLHDDLFAEYRKYGRRKRYVGGHPQLKAQEGFAWPSTIIGRWCFLPLKTMFSIDNVMVVNGGNLTNS